ncbi:class I SAM-dependent methyltransferase [Streptomyces sp. VRA16 Mangrove soil]|uniref:class I SAM-dependent methyltransferase n=1 Tax=Streptomyces sp. VRA16 Mangrove soil TaxID=2817434 RepID=UPI001A9D5E0E|nr:class I SAM-dependent methyltransferase [Streptomyces sp. VRA16 Mangrove soil]MBO1333318.1 class I SAM-dependent methyltransferase [Streptomyces sp. VRA16 Mangrove soil]
MTPTAQAVAERRPAYLTELARGTERFHEPRRPDCPWCGRTGLRTRLRTTDLLQRKPGTFVIDQCRSCGHSFQNPRLTPEGLDFYYRDFYDGLHADRAEKVFGARTSPQRHRARARALARHLEPESWLDVGTGRAHFPSVAKEVLPYTAFDGLDVSDGVEEGRRAGHIEEAHQGLLTDLAPRLAGRYDAMSMFHHLEHSLDPREELKAAHRVLRPGGHLMIEVPDPECRYAKLLGKWWVSYFQPQHLHFIPLANLRTELAALGYTVVAVDRREPHVPLDLAAACALLLGHCLPDADDPWRTKAPTGLQRRVRRLLTHASAPAFAAAYGADRLLAPAISRTAFSNAYRVIARRNPDRT